MAWMDKARTIVGHGTELALDAGKRLSARRSEETPGPVTDVDPTVPIDDSVLVDAFALTRFEAAHGAVLKVLLASRDVDAATAPPSRAVKADLLAAYVRETAQALAEASSPVELPATAEDLSDVARAAGAAFDRRSRAMLVLVDLHTFRPWPFGHPWNAKARERSLDEIASFLPGLRPGDRTAVATELEATMKALKRRQVKWGRVAAVGVVGLGLGAATMGLAAPLIGASIGAATGLSGAAATSAGLAALGGGSIAAGGLGVAGGTAVVASVGALAGAGAAAGSARATSWASPGQIALDALRAEVVTRLVVLDEEHDEEQAKRVVQALQARLDAVTTGISVLGERIRALTEENADLRAELEEQRSRARFAEAALATAIERIPVETGTTGG